MLSPPPLPEIILTATPTGPITAYDPHSGALIARFTGDRCPRNGICLLGNNHFAASHVSPETRAGFIRIYDWCSTSCKTTIPLPEPVAPLVASVNGSFIFSGGISGQIHSVSVDSGDVIRSFPVHERPISSLAINCDGSLILSGSDDGTIAVIPLFLLLDPSFDSDLSYSSFVRFTGHESSVTGLTTGVGASGGIMISSSLDATCKVWSLVNGSLLQTVTFPDEVWCVVVDPFVKELFAAGVDGMIYRRRIKVEKRKEVVEGGKIVVCGGMECGGGGGVVAMVMLRFGSVLLSVCENGGICAWEVESGKMIRGFGDKNIGGVSGVLVVKGGGGFGKREVGSGECSGHGGGNEVGKAVKKVAEMEERLKMAVEDRGKAISNLESAIEINEKMLNLMIREAKAIAKLNDSKNS